MFEHRGTESPEDASPLDAVASPDATGSSTADADAAAETQDAAKMALSRARAVARDKGLRPGKPGRTSARRSPDPAGSPTSGSRSGDGRDPRLFADAAAEISRQLGWSQPLSIGGVIGRWTDVVGSDIAEHCTPETFEEGALVVRADSTAWATQIRLLLPQLQRRLAEEVGDGVVETITVLGPGGPSWRKGPRSVRGRGPRDTYG